MPDFGTCASCLNLEVCEGGALRHCLGYEPREEPPDDEEIRYLRAFPGGCEDYA